MEIRCEGCGADLKVNRNLVGTTIPCPQCGEPVKAEESQATAPRPTQRRRPEAPPPEPPAPPYTAWLFGVQAIMVTLGLSCLMGAFFHEDWNPPVTSYFQVSPMLLVPVGAGLLLLAAAARRMPVLMALMTALAVLWVCALDYPGIDASRVIALSLTMLGVWLALQHRRALTPC